MRFYVPNNELDAYMREQNAESKKQADSEEEDNEEMTAAKIFDDKIHQKANIG